MTEEGKGHWLTAPMLVHVYTNMIENKRGQIVDLASLGLLLSRLHPQMMPGLLVRVVPPQAVVG
jgi:hypothetical protein